jgi:uncharacterized protein YeeX (DUF496 family)
VLGHKQRHHILPADTSSSLTAFIVKILNILKYLDNGCNLNTASDIIRMIKSNMIRRTDDKYVFNAGQKTSNKTRIKQLFGSHSCRCDDNIKVDFNSI